MLESIGWLATAVFAASYFCKETVSLRRLQALAAVLWIAYGVLIGAAPVIVANVIVASLALWSSTQAPRRDRAKAEATTFTA
jgi:uncharacterized protein with PQ loop repeat